jgi:hypothetical protein
MQGKRTRVIVNISIDTEVDKSHDWRISNPLSFHSVEHGILDLLTPIFEQNGCRPTYLLSSEVIENKACVKALKTIRNCEFGTHLHGELVEPMQTSSSLADSYANDIQCKYDPLIEFKKMQTISNLFEAKFGFKPTSFRAGRFGAGPNTIECLDKLGYLVDTSVTPGVVWNLPQGRVDFTCAGNQPYWLSKKDICAESDLRILEVPISIRAPGIKKLVSKASYNLETSMLKRISDRVLPAIWLRPTYSNSSEMKRLATHIVKENRAREIIVLNMMFHSMEVIPGASPYSSKKNGDLTILTRIREIVSDFSKKGYDFLTLAEIFNEMSNIRT